MSEDLKKCTDACECGCQHGEDCGCEEYESDIVVLNGENGEEVAFEYLDTVELDGQEYAVMIPMEDEEKETEETEKAEEVDEDGEIMIFKISQQDGEDVFDTVEDETLAEKVYNQFKENNKDLYDFED